MNDFNLLILAIKKIWYGMTMPPIVPVAFGFHCSGCNKQIVQSTKPQVMQTSSNADSLWEAAYICNACVDTIIEKGHKNASRA